MFCDDMRKISIFWLKTLGYIEPWLRMKIYKVAFGNKEYIKERIMKTVLLSLFIYSSHYENMPIQIY